MRRSRAHKSGDHSLCVRCVVKRADPEVVAASEPVTDPAKGLQVLAGQLTSAYGVDPSNALLARELRMTLQALLAPAGGSLDGELAAFLAGFSSA